ncbi:MAG: 16S rRNA (cytosine(967)-C(5))-methyltransferase RsmB [Candidatus Eisenbacteria bacterium]|nr:16S rRNA (cytosine(967)-C(5))-methyltransferase RsmB [Candidatus Eisenbacteria bacterium]
MTARETALKILFSVETRKSFSDILLSKTLERSGFEKREKDFVTNIVRGTLIWKGKIDYFLNEIRKEGIDGLPGWIRTILRMGTYEILFLDGVPARATVDEAVKLAKKFGHPGTAGLVNAVLRKVAAGKDDIRLPEKEKSPTKYLAICYSHPEWIVERWLKRFGFDETEGLLKANNERTGLSIRVNRVKSGVDEIRSTLLGRGVIVEEAKYSRSNLTVSGSFSPVECPEFQGGLFTIQDESESLVAFLLDPHENEVIVDLCAAPGGKCTHIAENANDKCIIAAVELYPHRVKKLVSNVRRLGLSSVRPVVADGRAPGIRSADRVLVDAPCSGLGVLGKRPDARWRKKESSIAKMSELQLELLFSASSIVRKGGVLVYSVCSFEPEETSSIIERFIREKKEFSLESGEGFLPGEVLDERGIMKTFPHLHGTDGAFAARFVRN